MEHTIGIMLGVYKDFPPPPLPSTTGGKYQAVWEGNQVGKERGEWEEKGEGKVGEGNGWREKG